MQNQVRARIWPMGYSLLIPTLGCLLIMYEQKLFLLVIIMVTTTFSYLHPLFHVPPPPRTHSPSPAFLLLQCKHDGLWPPPAQQPLPGAQSCALAYIPTSGAWLPLLLRTPLCSPCQFPPLPFLTSNNSCSSPSKPLTAALSRLCSLAHCIAPALDS